MRGFSEKCLSWFRYVLTDKNDNWDLSILLWLYAVGLFLYKATTQPPPFDFLNFGAGCAGVFIAGKSLDWLTDKHAKVDLFNKARPAGDAKDNEE